MMDDRIFERRRLLQLFALGSLALPAAALAGCAGGQPPRRRGDRPRSHITGHGGNNGKSGGGGS